jgi:uncharacterized protein involved in type VI secretion and phage assembly
MDLDRKTLTITTVLGEQQGLETGPFLLAAVQGIEGVSVPFSYDLTLYRSPLAGDVNPARIVNTAAKFGIARKDKTYITRAGVIDTFEKTGTTERKFQAREDFLVYRARLVPAIQLLGREQVFRVFEGMTVLEIIREVIADAAQIDVNRYLAPRFGARDEFPTIDYCVQFNESTFAFISRLLAEFGIWYWFSHPGQFEQGMVEQMVLGRTNRFFDPCANDQMNIVLTDPGENAVADFRRGYQAVHRRLRVGDYNPIAPASPAEAQANIIAAFDVVPGDGSAAPRLQYQAFPTHIPVADPQGDATALASDAANGMGNEESRVFTVQGQSKNRSLFAATTFAIDKDTTLRGTLAQGNDPFGEPGGERYLVTRLAFTAFEPSLGFSTSDDVLNFINPFHWWDRETADQQQPGIDLASGLSSASLTSWLQDETKSVVGGDDINALSSGLSGITGVIGNVLQVLGRGVKEVFTHHDDVYANSFVAVPWDAPSLSALPLPIAVASVAHGPQLAVVIGPDGLDISARDIYTDALGRVRVRFPWHLDLPAGGETNPWKSDRRTAWVRVSDGWAGQGMGTQFLPRIGDEVVVSYLDGDPARPVITGRLYNAARGAAGLPFAANQAPGPVLPAGYAHWPGTQFTPGPNDRTLRSGIRTRSTPRPSGGGPERFNMLRFDDEWQKEQVLLRSQGRLDVTSFASWSDTSHGSRQIRVGGKDPKTGNSGGDLVITAGGEYDLHVMKNRYEGVDAGYQLTVKKDTVFDLQGSAANIVGSGYSLNATSVVIEASMKITLKVGGSFVVLDPTGVFIKGALVQINSGGSPDSTSNTDVTDPLDAGIADPGDPPNWLKLHPPGAGGGHHHHTAAAQHGLLVARNADGTMQVGSGIKIGGDPAYQDMVVQQLALMKQTQNGSALINTLNASGRQATIQPLSPPASPPNAFAAPTNGTNAANGTGSDSTVSYNPSDWPNPVNAPDTPGDVILFHEMTHAEHNSKGTRDMTPRSDNFDTNEEYNTIGPENQYRGERGIPPRPDHHSL